MHSITAVLLDKYPEGDPPELKRFTNQSDHMKAHAGQTWKPPYRAKYAAMNCRIDAADKLKPKDA